MSCVSASAKLHIHLDWGLTIGLYARTLSAFIRVPAWSNGLSLENSSNYRQGFHFSPATPARQSTDFVTEPLTCRSEPDLDSGVCCCCNRALTRTSLIQSTPAPHTVPTPTPVNSSPAINLRSASPTKTANTAILSSLIGALIGSPHLAMVICSC